MYHFITEFDLMCVRIVMFILRDTLCNCVERIAKEEEEEEATKKNIFEY